MFDFLRRHWRGELPLGISFWVNGLGICAALLLAEFIAGYKGVEWEPDTAGNFTAWMLGGFTLLAAIPAWQVIGIFRSADRHAAEVGTILAARLAGAGATVLMLVMAVRLAGFAGETLPATRIAYGFGGYARQVLVVADGRAVELRGGLSFGAAADIARAIATHPGIRRVILNSGGGALSEALRLRALITARHLDTDTTTQCSSACVSAYIAGRHRYLHGNAVMGFHLPRSTTPGVNLPDWYAREIAWFAQLGVPRAFLAHWVATGQRFWYPPAWQLREAGIVQTIVGEAEQGP